jgi:hypothetical protein
MIDPPFQPYRATVIPGWVGPNGQMNVAYSRLAFDRGTDALLNLRGIGGSIAMLA